MTKRIEVDFQNDQVLGFLGVAAILQLELPERISVSERISVYPICY
jgi:hypothetical protein